MSDPDKMIRILITALFSAGRNAVSGCGEKWPEMCKMAFYDSCLVFARGIPPSPLPPPLSTMRSGGKNMLYPCLEDFPFHSTLLVRKRDIFI